MGFTKDPSDPNALAWRPSYKQELYLALPWTIKEGFYAGAAGAGKSDVLLMYPIVHRWYEHPQFKGLFLRRTFPELRDEIIPRSKEYFKPLGAAFNKSESRWEFPSGALFVFGHCEHEDDVHKYDTSQWNFVAFDELTSFTEWQYLYITFERTRRTVETYYELPAIARSASNPGNIGHAWVKKRFIDPCPSGFKVMKGKGGNLRIYIPATLADNPHIDPDYSKSLDALDEAERQAKKFGSWTAYEGQVFSEFRAEKLSSEPPEALHVIDGFEIPEYWPRLVAIDWGFDAITWVGFAAVSPTGRVYIYRELTYHKTHIEEWASRVKEYIDRENVRSVVICHSAGQHRGQPHTILEQVSEALGRTVDLSGRDRVAGKMLLHEYLRWKQKYLPESEKPVFDGELAQWIQRNKGLEDYKRYLKLFESDKPEALPKLQIFSACTFLIDAIKACIYDKTRKEDVAEFKGDDPYDGVRYLLEQCDRYINESVDGMKKLQAQEELLDTLRKTQDWTSFYRNAKKLESKELSGPVAINRYSHRRRYGQTLVS